MKSLQLFTSITPFKKLPSERLIDIEAKETLNNHITLIECKQEFSSTSALYHAVGQILLYKAEYEQEYSVKVSPVIATFKTGGLSKVRKACKLMAIDLWELEIKDENNSLLYINSSPIYEYIS